VLQGAALANFKWAIWAALGVILSACYMLWMYQRVFYGEFEDAVRSHMPDLNLREWAVVVPLIAMMVWMAFTRNPSSTQSARPPPACSNKPRSMYPTGSISAAREHGVSRAR